MAVTNRLDESFQPVPVPNYDDWLRNHQEKGQTMKSFERSVCKAVPHATYVMVYYLFFLVRSLFYILGIKQSIYNQLELLIIHGKHDFLFHAEY